MSHGQNVVSCLVFCTKIIIPLVNLQQKSVEMISESTENNQMIVLVIYQFEDINQERADADYVHSNVKIVSF